MQTITQTGRRILYTEAGRPACEVRGDVLLRKARGSVHQLRKPPAWAFDECILREARRCGALFVKVCDVETDRTYVAPFDTLWQHGIRIQRGHGAQIALPLRWWRVEDPIQPSLF